MNEVLPHTIEELVLDGSVDPHLHGRNSRTDNDGKMEMIMKYAADEHEVAVLIGNTNPVLLTQEHVSTYLRKAAACVPTDKWIQLYAAPLLTDATTPEMVREMRRQPHRTVAFLKGFMAGVSNDSGHSVSDVTKLEKVLHACHDDSVDAPPIPVHWHMERKYTEEGEVIEMRHREDYAMGHDFAKIMEIDPEGSHTIKHVSDQTTLVRIDGYRRRNLNVYAELAPQYFAVNFEDIFEGPGGVGTQLNGHLIFWPLPKARPSQLAIRDAALSGKPYLFFGSDCAWHIDDPTQEKGVKITCDGVVCGGAAILPALSKSIVIEHFVNAGKAHLLNDFLSGNARRALNLPPAQTKAVYRRIPTKVPDVFFGRGPNGPIKVRPFMKSETYNWTRVS